MSDFVKVENAYYNLNNVTEIICEDDGDLVIYYSGDDSTRLSKKEAEIMREILDSRLKNEIIQRLIATT